MGVTSSSTGVHSSDLSWMSGGCGSSIWVLEKFAEEVSEGAGDVEEKELLKTGGVNDATEL